jgi:TRAP transporter TAXI family solute receptor
MYKTTLSALIIATVAGLSTAATAQKVTEIPWGTSAVGSSGHKALVGLATVLNREMKDYNITVQPTPGAVVSVKGYATGQQFLGYYGADVAFSELAADDKRFKGFKAQMKREPVQSFWTYTIETGVGILASNSGKIKQWSDLAGKRCFTGLPPWDVRAHLERAFSSLGVKHEYVPVDLATAGSLLNSGGLDCIIVYTAGQASPAPWITEAGLAADWAALNPSADEEAKLAKAGFSFVDVQPSAFKRDIHAKSLKVTPFYYGFHVGLEVPENDVYRMLKVIEKNADELVKADKSFTQIKDNMADMQRRGVASSIDFVPVHPGLAKYMREKGVWDSKWDSRIAKKMTN